MNDPRTRRERATELQSASMFRDWDAIDAEAEREGRAIEDIALYGIKMRFVDPCVDTTPWRLDKEFSTAERKRRERWAKNRSRTKRSRG